MRNIIFALLTVTAAFALPQQYVNASSEESGNTTVMTSSNAQEIFESTPYVVVKAYADWCGPCKALTPIYNEIAGEYSSKYLFTTLNGDEQKALLQKFAVKGYPTIILFKNGSEAARIVGFQPKGKIVNTLNSTFNE